MLNAMFAGFQTLTVRLQCEASQYILPVWSQYRRIVKQYRKFGVKQVTGDSKHWHNISIAIPSTEVQKPITMHFVHLILQQTSNKLSHFSSLLPMKPSLAEAWWTTQHIPHTSYSQNWDLTQWRRRLQHPSQSCVCYFQHWAWLWTNADFKEATLTAAEHLTVAQDDKLDVY